MSSWRGWLGVLMDLIGVKKRARECDSAASELMRSFHRLVRREMASDRLGALAHAYVWHDSVLLLAYVDGRPDACEKAICHSDSLKRQIDAMAPSYAVAVKGRAF